MAAFEWLLHNLQNLKSLRAPRDSTSLQARLKYFYSETIPARGSP